jgi:hypothetical protein
MRAPITPACMHSLYSYLKLPRSLRKWRDRTDMINSNPLFFGFALFRYSYSPTSVATVVVYPANPTSAVFDNDRLHGK